MSELLNALNYAVEMLDRDTRPDVKAYVMSESDFKFAKDNNLIVLNEFNKPFMKSCTFPYELLPVVVILVNKSDLEHVNLEEVERKLNESFNKKNQKNSKSMEKFL